MLVLLPGTLLRDALVSADAEHVLWPLVHVAPAGVTASGHKRVRNSGSSLKAMVCEAVSMKLRQTIQSCRADVLGAFVDTGLVEVTMRDIDPSTPGTP